MSAVLFPATIVPLDGPLVFLAGPIQGAPHWQADAIRWFTEHAPTVSVASPRRQHRSREFDYAAQVDWETHYLRRAAENGVILFWLAREAESVPGRAYAQTSRFELAEWKMRHERDGVRLALGVEEGFSGERYIRRRFGQDCREFRCYRPLPKCVPPLRSWFVAQGMKAWNEASERCSERKPSFRLPARTPRPFADSP